MREHTLIALLSLTLLTITQASLAAAKSDTTEKGNAKQAWGEIKQGSKEAWHGIKSGSKEAWKESKKVGKAVKKESKGAWQSIKDAFK